MPEKVKAKQYFLVRLEGEAPVIHTLRVLAADEDEAFNIATRLPHLSVPIGPPEINLRLLKVRKASVKNTLTGMINWLKNFPGIIF